MKVDFKKLTSFCGLLGPAIIILGSIATAMAYQGREGESYSILRHFISKLGEAGVSRLAPVFNNSLIIGGLVLVISVVGLGLILRTRLGFVASGFGVFSSFCCSLVGVFPMNNFFVHTRVAFSFFYSGLVAIALFDLVILFDKEKKLSKWLLIPGIFTVVCFASFLIIPPYIRSAYGYTHHSVQLAHSNIRIFSILEWSVFISVMAWFVLMSISLMARRRTAEKTE
jgi:hypothetical protein